MPLMYFTIGTYRYMTFRYDMVVVLIVYSCMDEASTCSRFSEVHACILTCIHNANRHTMVSCFILLNLSKGS